MAASNITDECLLNSSDTANTVEINSRSKISNHHIITVRIGAKTFRMKRETLIRHSTYFENTLTNDLSSIDLSTITDDPGAVITILKWMKGKGLDLTRENVSSVINVAMKLNITAVMRMGIDFLMGELHLQNENVIASSQHSSFQEILNGPYFRHMSVEQLCRLLSDDQLDIEKEKEVFNAAIKWLRHDWNRRQHYVTRLMECVRFGLMSDRDILDISNSSRSVGVMEIPECQSYILSGLMYRVAQATGNAEECMKFAPKPRFCLRQSPHLRAGDDDDDPFKSTSKRLFEELEHPLKGISKETENYRELRVEKSHHSKELLTESSRSTEKHIQSTVNLEKSDSFQLHQKSICLANDPCLVVIGGINPDNFDYPQNGSSLLRFSPRENSWDVVLELPEPRMNTGAAYLAGIIYIIGGCIPTGPSFNSQLCALSTVRTLHVDKAEWDFVEPLLHPRMHHGVCECRGHIYAVGGNGKDGRLLDSVECFDPSCGQWSSIDPLGTARMAMTIGVFDSQVWVCGGLGSAKRNSKLPEVMDTVEYLCLDSNRWQYSTPLRHPLCFSAMTNFFGHLCLLGGSVWDSECKLVSSPDVDILDRTTKTWRKITKLDVPRHSAIAIALGQHLHLIGGASTTSHSALTSVECYSFHHRSWVGGVSPLPVPLIGMSVVLLPPRRISKD